MQTVSSKKKAGVDLLILFLSALVPAVIYLFFRHSWETMSKSANENFWPKFILLSLLAFCLTGLGFLIVMFIRKETFAEYGLTRKNAIPAIVLSVVAFIPHFIFRMVTNGFNGYAPMSGASIYDSVASRPMLQKIFCLAVLFLIWGFCEGFTYVYVDKKLNILFPVGNKFLSTGPIVCGILCVMMHGGIPTNTVALFDALTMFLFVYGILIIKEVTGNAWGCLFSFFFLWNAFP